MTGFLTEIVDILNKYVFGTTLPLLILSSGIYFCFRLRFFCFLHPIKTIKRMLAPGGGTRSRSSFRALSLALAGTLGVGNIAGVTLAIMSGGAGAVLWMCLSALAAMLIKFAEITLAIDTRVKNSEGAYIGGAPYYILRLGEGRWVRRLSYLFAGLCVACALAMGGVLQSNTVAECLSEILEIPPLLSGGLLALLTAAVVFGGAKKISLLTSRLIPALTIIYALLSLVVIARNSSRLPEVLREIFSSAFSFAAAGGGVSGFFLSAAVRTGISRGLISNEAGCGTAPIAHATTDTEIPAKQGLLGVVEVFVDTILLCTLTALVVLTSFDTIPEAGGGMSVTVEAFSGTFGSIAGYILSFSVFCFAYSTIICWAYYGSSSLSYFTESKRKNSVFLALYCLSVLVGAVSSPEFLWAVNDLTVSMMSALNIVVVTMMADRVVALSAKYGLLSMGDKTRMREREAKRGAGADGEKTAAPPRMRTYSKSQASRGRTEL